MVLVFKHLCFWFTVIGKKVEKRWAVLLGSRTGSRRSHTQDY